MKTAFKSQLQEQEAGEGENFKELWVDVCEYMSYYLLTNVYYTDLNTKHCHTRQVTWLVHEGLEK